MKSLRIRQFKKLRTEKKSGFQETQENKQKYQQEKKNILNDL